MNNTAFTLRGIKYAQETHPEALEAFYGIRHEAQILADQAYDAAPDFVPASDAKLMLQLAQRTLSDDAHIELTKDIMTATPNVGSLGRALNIAMPQWGGNGFSKVAQYCALFAKEVPDVDDYSEDVCVAHMIDWIGLGDMHSRATAWKVLEDTQHSALKQIRIKRALELGLKSERGFLLDWFRESHNFDYVRAADFREKFPYDDESEAVFDEMDKRLQSGARAQLPHDPYHPNLITVLQRRYFPLTAHKDEYDAEALESYALRRTVSQPFDPYVWQNAARFYFYSKDHPQAYKTEPFYSNAIYYSMHSETLLSGYFNQLMTAYDRQKRMARKTPAADMLLSSDALDELVLCPTVRVTRVMRAACIWRTDNAPKCESLGNVRKSRDILADVEKRGVCEPERFGDIEELYYMPVEINAERITKDMANR